MPSSSISNRRTRKARRRGAASNGAADLARLPVHRVSRTVVRTLAQIATDQGYEWRFAPSTDVTDWADIANVFDQYRVAKIDLKWTCPRSDPAEFPTLIFAPDWNDTGIPASRGFLLNYETCKTHQFSENKRTCMYSFVPRPRILSDTSTDVNITGAGVWAHTSQNLFWLGVKSFITQYNSTSNATAIVEVYATIHLEFKNSR